MLRKDGKKNKPDHSENNFEHTIANIATISRQLNRSRQFETAFTTICDGKHPSEWKPSDAKRIMLSYQLIFRTMKKEGPSSSLPIWKLSGYAKAAMWFYETYTNHAFANIDYYLAACEICLSYPVSRISQSTPANIVSDPNLPTYVATASQAAAITSHIERIMYHSENVYMVTESQQKQLATHYIDISLVFQAAGDYDTALVYHDAALKLISVIPTQDNSLIKMLHGAFHEMCITFHFNPFYRELFSLMSDYFKADSNASFQRLAQLEFNCQHTPGVDNRYESMLAQCLFTVYRYANVACMPNTNLKKQLQHNYYYNRLLGIMQAHNLQSLQDSFAEPSSPFPSPTLVVDLDDLSSSHNAAEEHAESFSQSQEVAIEYFEPLSPAQKPIAERAPPSPLHLTTNSIFPAVVNQDADPAAPDSPKAPLHHVDDAADEDSSTDSELFIPRQDYQSP